MKFCCLECFRDSNGEKYVCQNCGKLVCKDCIIDSFCKECYIMNQDFEKDINMFSAS